MDAKPSIRVPLLDLKAQYEVIGAEVESAVRGVLASQQYILGPEVRELEQEIAAYCGSAHAIGCASGSDALLLALMAAGVGPGDEVVTTPFSFFATAGSIVRLGARPVFVDIEESTFNIDPNLIAPSLTNRTKAIIPVHLFGQCADMDAIKDVTAGREITIIEDAAQAIGSQYKGRRAGNLGLAGAFSFYPSKNLGGAGDGGLLTTNDTELAQRLRCLRTHGAKDKYFHEYVGLNSRLDSLQAAILRVKLRHLDRWTEARRRNAERYRRLFFEAGLVASGRIQLPEEKSWGLHVYNQFVIGAERRDELRACLRDHGVGTEIYYPLPLHRQECFKGLGYQPGSLPVSERASEETLALPIYPELAENAQEYVVERIAAFYA